MSISERFCCSTLTFLSSVILVIVGFAQIYFTCADYNRIDYIHLVFQNLAGCWSVSTGALCIYSQWKKSSAVSIQAFGKKIFLIINFLVEIVATFLLLAEMSGVNVSLKQYVSPVKLSHLTSLKIRAKDVMYLATSGSLSIFMGMIIWITSFCITTKKEDLNGDLNIKFLSARCKSGNDTETFLLDNTFVWPNYLSRKESLHNVKDSRRKKRDLENPDEKSKAIFILNIPREVEINSESNSNKIPLVHKKKSPVQNQGAKETKTTSYIRFYDNDDSEESPGKETLYASNVNEKKMTPLASIKRYSISPRRSPLKVATPTPPKYFSGKRTLSSPFRLKMLGTINEKECLKLLSPRSQASYHTPGSRLFGTWSSGYNSTPSRFSDYQSVFSSCSSPDVSCP